MAPQNSGHSRGSTVDLTIHRDSIPLEMGTDFDFFGPAAHTDYAEISNEARVNRRLLIDMMQKHGFINYPCEWWHYTLENEPHPQEYFDFVVE